MRRRTLLGGDSTDYVFSAKTSVSISYSGSSTNVSIKSTANGTNIGYSVVSYDGTVVTGVTTAATRVTIRYSANSTYESRSGNVVLKQSGSNKTITINVSQSSQPLTINYNGILLDGTSGSGSIDIATSVTFSNVPSWASVYYSDGKINVEASDHYFSSTARRADITVSVGSSSKSLTIIQLPSDYHSRDYVSIGGKNWSIKNIGASSVQDYGNYYQWGAGAVTYKNEDQYHTGGTDTGYTLPSSADTATQVMGSGWRMPTVIELHSLIDFDNSYYWVSYNGVNGGVFYSSGNVLFFPAAGYYTNGSLIGYGSYSYVWSSTPYNSSFVRYLDLDRGGNDVYNNYRFIGIPVRGVYA